VVTAALAIALLAAVLAQAAHAQEDSDGVADRLDELSGHVERANGINTILYVVSFAVGAGLACIAIYATHGNAQSLRRQIQKYEERTALLRRDIDEGLTPLLTWTQAGERPGGVLADGSMLVRIVNAGRGPALRVTCDVTHLLSRGASAHAVVGEERHSWGALLPDESIEMRVMVPDEALKATAGGGSEFRADMLVEYESVGGKEYRLRVTARYDGTRVEIHDVDA